MNKNDAAPSILIVDDEKNLRESLIEYLSLDGFSCTACGDGNCALSLLSSQSFDAVILDLRLPGPDGLEILTAISSEGPRVPVIMMSAHGEIQDAVAAMKLGAFDYLVKPFDPAELVLRLNKAIAAFRLERMVDVGRRLSEQSASVWRSTSPAMKSVYKLVERAAPVQSTVLISGESGTGKEVIAHELHRLSSRSEGPFVPVNVGAIPESLLESELFGYEKGAFTGAGEKKQGLFELASGGTLFLDELGEMPLPMQVKLLRVLQDRTIMRLGGTRMIPVDVRILAATNRNLAEAVRTGTFREDLFFRINVLEIHLPPLRERTEDIAPLAGFFISRFARDIGKAVQGISPEALDLLRSYPFPGNIRELENSIERAVILADGVILQKEDFIFPDSPSSPAVDSADRGTAETGSTIRDAEKNAVLAALEHNGWHREKTAAELGISRRTLLNKMKEYGLQ